jgi:hypothetical protein
VTIWQRWKQTAIHNKALVLTSILVAFGTVFYAGAAGFQVWLMNNGSKHADEQIGRVIGNVNWMARALDEAAKETERNNRQIAQNAEQSIRATQEQMRLDERAWVGVSGISITLDPSKPLKFETRVVILGKSPATSIVTKLGMNSFPKDHVLRPSDIVLDKRELKNGTAVPMGSFPVREIGADPVNPMEQATIEAILGKTYVGYFFGETTYRDIFRMRHWTRFCFVIPSGNSDDSYPCPIYNDSDGDTNPTRSNPARSPAR